MRVVSMLISNPEDAEDVVQETFLKAFRGLNGFRNEASFFTWLYRIATNVSKNYLRGKHRHELIFSRVNFDSAPTNSNLENSLELDTPELLLIGKQVESSIRFAIAQLPDDIRDTLALQLYDSLSNDQISKRLACPTATVRTRIFRARAATKNYLERC
jgi:RNA polymerase sigma-70 factor (ECF subfamily)